MTTQLDCQDCEFAALVDNDDAEWYIDSHEAATGHNVEKDGADSQSGPLCVEAADVEVTTEDGQPALQIGESTILLRTWVKVGDEEAPLHERTLETTTEVDSDDAAWWEITNDDGPYPWVTIQPEMAPDETETQEEVATDGGTEYDDPLEAVDGETEVEIECAVGIHAPRDCDGWCETVELDEPADYTGQFLELPGFNWECPECGNPNEFEVEGIRVSNLV